jgi:dihydrofolate reductase
MGAVIFSMTVSLDGFVADPDGRIDWSSPDEELHRFHNDRVRELGAQLLGRRLYEEMLYWETAKADWGDVERDFAEVWQALPKVVFSRTLDEVEGKNLRLAKGDLSEEVARVKAQTEKDVGVGGAGLAAALIERGLVDEYQLFFSPVVLGGGTPFFPPLRERLDLELLETRTFASRIVYARYGVRAG